MQPAVGLRDAAPGQGPRAAHAVAMPAAVAPVRSSRSSRDGSSRCKVRIVVNVAKVPIAMEHHAKISKKTDIMPLVSAAACAAAMVAETVS